MRVYGKHSGTQVERRPLVSQIRRHRSLYNICILRCNTDVVSFLLTVGANNRYHNIAVWVNEIKARSRIKEASPVYHRLIYYALDVGGHQQSVVVNDLETVISVSGVLRSTFCAMCGRHQKDIKKQRRSIERK